MSEGDVTDDTGPERPDRADNTGPERPDRAEDTRPERPDGADDIAPDATVPGRWAVDPASLLLAVERVSADVAALGRALASQPAEVAARLDVDAATASIGVRVGALGSALDQFRLSLLAALDRTAERLDEPVWLPGLQDALNGLEPRLDAPPWLPDLQAAIGALEGRFDAPQWVNDLRPILAGLEPRLDAPLWLPALRTALTDLEPRLDDPPWLPQLQGALADLQSAAPVLEAIRSLDLERRLDQLTATLTRTGDDGRGDAVAAAIAAADPADRLARLEQAVADLSDGVRAGAAVADALDHLGERLIAIEGAAGRVAEDARVLVEQVSPVPDRLSAIAVQIDRITPLARAGDQAVALFEQLDRVGTGLEKTVTLLRAPGAPALGGADEGEEDERFEALIDVLAGVTRRQDQVTAAIASVLDQVRGPRGVDAILERTEQRERSLAARLDRIDAELRQRSGAPGSSASAEPRADAETAKALEAVVAMVEQHQRVLGFRLDQIDGELHRVGEVAAAAAEARREPDAEAAELLRSVLARVDEQEGTIGRHLDWVGARLAEVAAHLVPADEPEAAEAPVEDTQLHELGEILAAVAGRQDELAASIAGLVGQSRGPTAIEAVFDRMEQRERSLAARLDRIDHQLRRQQQGEAGAAFASTAAGSPIAPEPADGAALSLGASVEAIAAVAENLAALVESTTDRLDRRLARVEAVLDQEHVGPPAPPQPTSTAQPSPPPDAALRLARLRAERAEVQARLQEERLLATRTWDDDEL